MIRLSSNPYKILQVDPEAEPEVIESAYKRLAVKYHPDRDPSRVATERMKAINSAYDLLKNPEGRRQYDRQRERELGLDVGGKRSPGEPSPVDEEEKATIEHSLSVKFPVSKGEAGRVLWGLVLLAVLFLSPRSGVILLGLSLVAWFLRRPLRLDTGSARIVTVAVVVKIDTP